MSPPPRVKTVGIIGAGTMGAGIAIAFLLTGFPVTLVDAKKVGAVEGDVDLGFYRGDGGFVLVLSSTAMRMRNNYVMTVSFEEAP